MILIAQISEAEFYINGTEFKFYCKPYFLRYMKPLESYRRSGQLSLIYMHALYAHVHTHSRLHLPGELVDDDRQKASYDIDSGGYSRQHLHVCAPGTVYSLNCGHVRDKLKVVS